MKKLVLTIVFTFGLMYLFPHIADASTLSLSSNKSKVTKDDTITISVQLEAEDEINAVQANISYPQDKLKLLSTNTADSAFDIDAPSSGGNGDIQITRGVTGNGIKGTKKVAEIKFRAEKDSGSATISLKTDSSTIRVS